ncbi:MAG: SDR family oxidoreductase [Saprospiraceae bacterium]|nr:SDR family oxidoreductase [Saprospiraceae bacterium]
MSAQSTSGIAFIAGGTRGIGAAVARYLVKTGAAQTLFLNYLENSAAAEALKNELQQQGATVHLLPANLAFPDAVRDMFEQVAGLTDRLDYFVHSAALTTFKPLHAIRSNQWDLTMNVSAKSFLTCTQGCLPLMQHGGQVVAISSTGALRFNPDYGALGIAKSALENMVRYLAVELAPRGIRVNGVSPGLISGENLPPFPQIDLLVAETLRHTPAGRLGTPEDVAEVVHFLLTGARWMTGQVLVLDGGCSLV